jgi:hypothetical protein
MDESPGIPPSPAEQVYSRRRYSIYFTYGQYYAAQAMKHVGGKDWQE